MLSNCQCWRRFLRVPWTARRSNQSILKEINSEYSLEGLMLKLKLSTLAIWCKELSHWKRPWCWERLRAWREGGNRGCSSWMASLTQWTWVWASSGRQWRTGKPHVLQSIGLQSRTWQWLNNNKFLPISIMTISIWVSDTIIFHWNFLSCFIKFSDAVLAFPLKECRIMSLFC